MPVIISLVTRDITFYNEETSRLQRLVSPRYSKQEITAIGNEYLAVWIHYYSEILSHVQDTAMHYVAIPFEEMIVGSFGRIERLHELGYDLRPPKNFNVQLSRSRKHMRLDFIPDPELVRIGDGIDQRFRELLQNSLS